jgi:ATP/maltotriose-dependent transcriptional regulator MalT
MVDEAAALLPEHERDFDWCWARALARTFDDAPDAGPLLEEAVGLARAIEERFGECECLIRLVQLYLDRSEPAQALAWCRELMPVAAKMSEGSEGAVADALEALARVACCVPGADDHLERALGRLRDFDAKGMLAYVLSSAAEIDHASGRLDRAERRAEEALAAARVVDRHTLVMKARAVLAEVACSRGAHDAARALAARLTADLTDQALVQARTRARAERIAARILGGRNDPSSMA